MGKSILIALALTVLAAAVPASAQTQYGLEWTGQGTSRRMLYWHNPFPIYDATYIFKVYPRKKSVPPFPNGYYTTFFWGNDGNFAWDGGNAGTYYGMHPYPTPAPNGPGQWEISIYSNDYVTGQEVQWNRWYTQAIRVWRESSSLTHHEFYWDWPNTSRVIKRDINDPNWAKQNPPVPAVVIGQAPDMNGPTGNSASWGGYPGWEEFNGIIRGIQIYSGLLSLADIQAELNAPKSSAAGQTHIWYLNVNPRPTDVADKKGQGTVHNALWRGSTASEWVGQGTAAEKFSPESWRRSFAGGPDQIEAFPNPARGEMTFRIPVAAGSRGMTFSIFNPEGKRVAAIRDHGSGEYRWNARRLPRGVYSVSAAVDGRTLAKKFALLR